ncbi:hypothetical protein ABZ891_15995 [Streptomyces sp. NPDC047023]|uniref:hypothetical protein n=1 Tax=Streptomyces sp. NPDC047023 TaxID=3155139 RepID=UPI0033E5C35C
MSPGALCAVGAAVLSVTVAARAGALTQLWDFLDFGAGVLSLVSLTATVLWGLVATDRQVLKSGHRLLAQGVHRGLAVSGLGFLALHIWVKIAEQQTTASAAVVPFADPARPVLIGFGTLAGYLFLSVAISGAARSVFATKKRSMLWRALHMGAYPAWGASLVHGLKAGRPADTWVTASYALALVGVAAILAYRLKSRLDEGSSGPVGQGGPTPEPVTAPIPRPRREPRPQEPPRPAAPPRPEQPPRTAVYAPRPAAAYADSGGPGGGDTERFATRERWT